jgi:hypothetical protein
VNAAVVESWAAWAPGIEDADAWRAWARRPVPLGREGQPDVPFLPALLRRRCSPLARIMLTTAFDCTGDADRSSLRTVFASRHGNINESIDMLERLARRQPLSPTRFSHTVHNAQAGLFSIAADNCQPSSSMAAGPDTFACGFLEALTHLQREPDRPVLLVMADVPLAPTFAALVTECVASYGVALRLVAAGDGVPVRFGCGTAAAPLEPGDWPEAIEFLRWLLGDEPRLDLGLARTRFTWQRAA